jgi:beta-galactosidase GanA
MTRNIRRKSSRVVKSSSATPKIAQPPYVGAAYYPEVAGDEIDRDIRQMLSVGVNMVRMAEFAWSKMEPDEGRYDFKWLHRAVDKCGDAGIAVVLCTPTATPPVWLSLKHPEILRVNAAGLTVGHGGRRQYCPNSPVYMKYSVGIAERLAVEFAGSPALIAWQVDNEFWEECCPPPLCEV